jgi:hypothetical protein
MHRRRLPIPLAGLAGSYLALTATALTAAEATAPDLRGEWKMEADAIVVGRAPHHPADAAPPAEGTKPRLRAFTGTMRVVGQEGDRFWGVIDSPAASDEFVGMFTGDGGRFIRVDVDGFAEGELGGDGMIRYCYRHVTSDSRVVSCGTATRR